QDVHHQWWTSSRHSIPPSERGHRTDTILLIAWQFVPFAASLKAGGDRTWVLGWPVWPWWSVAAVMMWLAAFVQAMVLVIDLIALFHRTDDPLPHDDTTSAA
ncbi:hypothetical protein LCC70_14495, partial [Sulfitobacter pseudonitzschiae]|nr:hypothetical protein [Pseudosulfitobacter pseudonitzschiae]MCD2352830.1 hypothetical protein [Pseudosulfitobacter pseudonitzschiae]